MVRSIVDDVKSVFRSGNMISKIILVNIGLFVIINLIRVFDFGAGSNPDSIYNILNRGIALPSSMQELLTQPWSIVTHMFLHNGFWHILWNMLLLFWFGRIVGDFIGDKRILPLYFLGGFAGAIIYILSDNFLPSGSGGHAIAMGASAAVMAIIWTAAALSPDYIMHLILIGPIKLKYIALALLFLDIIGTAGMHNSGGHFAHIGGALLGIGYVFSLRNGTDLASPLQKFFDFFTSLQSPKIPKTPRKKLRVIHGAQSSDQNETTQRGYDEQEELDRILDKINLEGYEKLTPEEKEFLYLVSKKK